MEVLVAKNLKKTFGKFEAIRDLSIQVNAGECVGLLGPNGAGKSTFIGTSYGVVQRTAGDFKVFGMDPQKQGREIKSRIGVVPQENALDEGLTVLENMQLYAAFKGVAKTERDGKIEELLKYMSLDHKIKAPIQSLSGGMKRRLAFVRALLGSPELIILDEPTTGLDPAIRHLLWEKVMNFREQGKTVLVTTHYMHEAEILCERIIILNKGVVVGEGSPTKLIAEHSPGFVGIFADKISKADISAQWFLSTQNHQSLIRSPNLEELIEFQKSKALKALQLRPSNLEDVFLKLTGEDLSPHD